MKRSGYRVAGILVALVGYIVALLLCVVARDTKDVPLAIASTTLALGYVVIMVKIAADWIREH